MIFLTVAELKAQLGVTELEVIRNPNTQKLFVGTPSGSIKLKCEQALDKTLPIRFMYEGAIQDGTLVNVKPNTDNVVMTL